VSQALAFTQPLWRTAGVQHGQYSGLFALKQIINCKWEAASQAPKRAAWLDFDMNTGTDLQGINVGIQTVQKVSADASLLVFVKPVSRQQIVLSRLSDLNGLAAINRRAGSMAWGLAGQGAQALFGLIPRQTVFLA
jgi:hypothetical protein